MPNWCMNTVTFKNTDPKEISRLQEAFERDELFSEFAPNPNGKDSEDWYAHNINEWGTKWDTGGTADSIHEQTADMIMVTFDSASSPPISFYEIMEELGWEVEAYYYEPGMSFCGKYTTGYGDEYYDVPDTSDEVLEEIPADIDDMFAISEHMSDNESEQEEEDEE